MRKISFFILFFCLQAYARTEVEVELGPAWQSRNDFKISPSAGTLVKLQDVDSGPFIRGRGLVNVFLAKKHALRFLLAPFSVTSTFTPASAITFNGNTFAAGTATTISYQFNSYRLSYVYHFNPESDWAFRLGFTGKIRSAFISVSNATSSSTYSDLGFVPLLHFGMRVELGENWSLDLDGDALAAPQGRAEDIALRVFYRLNNVSLYAGYRMLEGGADNSKVFTFSFFHYAVFGVRVSNL